MYWLDIARALLDVGLVTFLIYKSVIVLQGTKAIQILKGVGVVLIVWVASSLLGLTAVKFILSQVLLYGLLGLMIIFQPELRTALEKLGKHNIRSKNKTQETDTDKMIQAITDSCDYMAKRKIGALICIEQNDSLDEYSKTGISLTAEVSKELLTNIFTPNVPLHDGALIIQDGRINSASCYLPLSESTEISKELGTRHRASIGLSEVTDAVTVIVSEETGAISLTKNSKLIRGITPDELKTHLEIFLIHQEKPSKKQGGKTNEK